MGSSRGFPKFSKEKILKKSCGCPDGYELAMFKVKFEKGRVKGREIKRHYCKKIEEKQIKQIVKEEIKERTKRQKIEAKKEPKTPNPIVTKQEIETKIEEAKEKTTKQKLAEKRIERKKLEAKKKEPREPTTSLERTKEELEREKQREIARTTEQRKQESFQERVFGYNVKEYKEREKEEKEKAKERAISELNLDYEDNLKMSQNLRKKADELLKNKKIDSKKRDQIHQSLVAIERDFTKKKTDLEKQIKSSDYQQDINERNKTYKEKRGSILSFARNMNTLYNVQ